MSHRFTDTSTHLLLYTYMCNIHVFNINTAHHSAKSSHGYHKGSGMVCNLLNNITTSPHTVQQDTRPGVLVHTDTVVEYAMATKLPKL